MTTTDVGPTTQEQAGALLSHVAGYVAHRTISTGIRTGLIPALAEREEGATAEELAAATGCDPFYVGVWCRSAFGAGVCEQHGDVYRLAPHVDTLLLDEASPAYIGGVFEVLEQPEIFDAFERRLPTGERMWWDECDEAFLRAVSGTGRPFYQRLIPGALERIDDLGERLAAGARVLDTACGAGFGLLRLLEVYPSIELVGADGDRTSLDLAGQRLEEAGFRDRVEFVCCPLEELDRQDEFDLVTNNVSMHECRDIDAVTANIRRALRPGGWFVISDFPFPDTAEGLRTVPGRIMSGIQFFEALIDDQLVAPQVYIDLLGRHGFEDVDTFQLTPVHAVTYGRRP